MIPQAEAHPWSVRSLVGKAALYIDRMESVTADDWQYGLWSALGLELLARAALAKISPTLLADDWRNVSYALGHPSMVKKFSPASVTTSEVFKRLKELLPSFTDEIAGFCSQHIDRRNSELHSGELAFVDAGTSAWLAKFYLTCKVLLVHLEMELADLFSNPEAVQSLIESLEDAAAKAVDKDIKAHKQVWLNKSGEEQEKATLAAKTWAQRHSGHRAPCPACRNIGLLQASPGGPVATQVTEDEVVERQTVLPSSFECVACGLRIAGLSRLSACGLGDAFTAKSTFLPSEFFGLYTDDDLEEARREGPQFIDDMNE